MKLFTPLFISILLLTGSAALAQEEEVVDESVSNYELVISEVSLGSSDSASEEFVEISNISVEPQFIDGLSLQYKSSSGSSWTTKAELSGWVAPYGRILISNYLEDKSINFSGGLSGVGGHLRISTSDQQTIDLIAWGTAQYPEVESVPAHQAGQSLKRLVDEDGRFLDTNNNLQDWFISDNPTPSYDFWEPAEQVNDDAHDEDTDTSIDSSPDQQPEDQIAQEPDNLDITDLVGVTDDSINLQDGSPSETDPSQPEEIEANNQTDNELVYALLKINELMPDPAPPLIDDEHEFVELYNPNKYTVQLKGYVIESGSNWRYRYELGDYALSSGEYLAIYSQDSGLALSNSGTSVRLLSPDGSQLDLVTYPKSKVGLSYSLIAGEWSWVDPSPHSQNQIQEVLSVQDDSRSAAGPIAESNNASKVKTATSAPLEKRDIEFPSQADNQQSTQETAQSTDFNQAQDNKSSNLNNSVLVGVGLVAVLYAIYEYRNEIRIRFERIRRYIAFRRENRT